jgi:hypothetical protein
MTHSHSDWRVGRLQSPHKIDNLAAQGVGNRLQRWMTDIDFAAFDLATRVAYDAARSACGTAAL